MNLIDEGDWQAVLSSSARSNSDRAPRQANASRLQWLLTAELRAHHVVITQGTDQRPKPLTSNSSQKILRRPRGNRYSRPLLAACNPVVVSALVLAEALLDTRLQQQQQHINAGY